MPKIYLSPAYHYYNKCYVENCDETTHNNLYLDELEPYLKACGIEYKRGTRRIAKSGEDGTVLMYKAIKESNEYKPDIHYVSHTNGYDGTVQGYRPMVYKYSGKNKELADIMFKWRKKIYTMGKSGIYERPDLAELNSTDAVAFYEEHIFHDNKKDAEWFHKNLRKIAEYTCRGFCEYFGISFVDPYEKKTDEKTDKKTESKDIYRVCKSWKNGKAVDQIGAYNNLDLAIAFAKENLGYKVYDSNGKVKYEGETAFKSYIVKVVADALNIRSGAGTKYNVVGVIYKGEAYTIIDEKSGVGASKWGKLKSGAGWISLDYIEKL